MNKIDSRLGTYRGGKMKVVVYNTYAADRRFHFDVFLPIDGMNASEMDAAALESAREFLALIGEPHQKVRIDMCDRCHIDDTEVYKGQLWQLPGSGALIWPLEGCPKPVAFQPTSG